jgi:phosphotransferase system enzyme I (PtsI)
MDQESTRPGQEIRLKGIAVSPGVAMGNLVVIRQEDILVPHHAIEASQVAAEIARFEAALVATREQILQIKEHLSSSLGEKDLSIFDAHLLMVEDNSLLEAVKKQLGVKLRCVEYVYHHLMMAFVRSMRELDDPYLQERAADLTDVGRRVLNNLMGRKVSDTYALEKPSIILAHDLSPSDTALLDRTKVLGFATDLGSSTSHTAIMARSLNIPAVVGLRDASAEVPSQVEVLLDGYEGLLILRPSEKTKYEYGQLEQRRHEVEVRLDELRLTAGLTTDQRRIILSANVELPEDLPMIHEAGAEGIGLYRTEFLFLNRLDIPSEEEQMASYRKVMESAGEHGAIVRTLDLGGDKMPTSGALGEELNPFLGWRAIRYCLDETAVFRTQLRAILRAGAGLKIKVMFPMIATHEELMAAKEHLAAVRSELEKEGVDHARQFELGMMIEVPSAALIVDRLVGEVDFFSIGTNDLVQYTLAVDRTNEKIAQLYQPCHPGVIRLIQNVVDTAHAHGKWVGVCGEMAGDVRLTPLMVGLDLDELSMGSVSIPRVKRAVQSLSHQAMKELVGSLVGRVSAREIAGELEKVAQSHYPELLL